MYGFMYVCIRLVADCLLDIPVRLCNFLHSFAKAWHSCGCTRFTVAELSVYHLP